ncbi:unnamed protein product, partial [marine sediment metagenome]
VEALENERSEMRDKLEEQERRLKKLEDPVEELTIEEEAQRHVEQLSRLGYCCGKIEDVTKEDCDKCPSNVETCGKLMHYTSDEG